MLGPIQTHRQYQVTSQHLWQLIPKEFQAPYQSYFDLFQHLDLDPCHPLIKPLYATTGRPSLFQIQCLRSMILAVALNIPFPQLTHQLKLNRPFWIIAGFQQPDEVPSVGAFYDFMRRYCPVRENKDTVTQPHLIPSRPGKGRKLVPRRQNVVKQLIHRFQQRPTKHFFEKGPEKTLQRLFHLIAVQQSKAIGLLSDKLIVSGDGTCIPSHATPYSRKQCHCQHKKSCSHTGRLTDPNARWGYDSSKDVFFYGYTGYFLCTYQAELKKDLPLYFRLVEAQRHDSVSAVVALHEFAYLSPSTQLTHFLADAAHDNYAFYEWLDTQKVLPLIPLNVKKKGHRAPNKAVVTYSEDGTPYCLGEPMRYNGYMKDRRRHKWRCAICSSAPRQREYPDHHCSDSAYGRVVYTKSEDDPRLYPTIARQSKTWQTRYNERTSVERLNKTVMVDDGLEKSNIRSKTQIYWHLFASFVLIHLKAQIEFMNH